MRILFTGANGFVAPHVREALSAVCPGAIQICATSKAGGAHPLFGAIRPLDVTDAPAVRATVAGYRPTHLIHLAGIAAPRHAEADPETAWRVHLHGTLNVAEAILTEAPDCRLINAGSGLIYGESAISGRPLDEHTLLAPRDIYGATKAGADLALGALARRGLKVIRMRPFNHIGPGQSEDFVTAAFAAQVARIEAGLLPPLIKVGNLNAERDFLDVRDVARAYALAVRDSAGLEPDIIFNIASGTPQRIDAVLDRFLAEARVPITVEQDPARLRSGDLPRIVGDATRIRDRLGWAPHHTWEQTLHDTLASWRARVSTE